MVMFDNEGKFLNNCFIAMREPESYFGEYRIYCACEGVLEYQYYTTLEQITRDVAQFNYKLVVLNETY